MFNKVMVWVLAALTVGLLIYIVRSHPEMYTFDVDIEQSPQHRLEEAVKYSLAVQDAEMTFEANFSHLLEYGLTAEAGLTGEPSLSPEVQD